MPAPGSLQAARRKRITTRGAIDEVNVIAFGDRGHDAGHDSRRLAMDSESHDALVLGLEQALLDLVGKRGRAIERHAQVVVVLAEIRVLDHVLPINGRIEPAEADAE